MRRAQTKLAPTGKRIRFAVKLASQEFYGKLNFTFGKYFTVIYYGFTSNRRFETSQNKTPLEKEFFGSSSSGFVLYRSSRQKICTVNSYPKLTRAYTVRTGLFSCPAVLLFTPGTSSTRRSSALQGTQTAAVWLFGLQQV